MAKAEFSKSSAWPHANSESVIESTARWLDRFKEWPGYLEHPNAVAKELIERGQFGPEQLRRMGWKG